jgi:hypothetical protein
VRACAWIVNIHERNIHELYKSPSGDRRKSECMEEEEEREDPGLSIYSGAIYKRNIQEP